MSFLATPDWLDEYADLLARANSDSRAVRAHVGAHTQVGASTFGLLSQIHCAHEDFRAQAMDDCTVLARALDASEARLQIAADRYRTTERAAAARLDRQLPAVERAA